MDTMIRVSVFEGDQLPEVQLVKSKLEEAGISAEIDNSYLSFLSTPTATSMCVKVMLKDEQKALQIIDKYLQDKE